MHRFALFPRKEKTNGPRLQGAHLLGADGVPVRSEITLEDGVITCKTKSHEALGISLLWQVEGFGAVQLETTRLPARDEPYHLHIELARHRLMRISTKREEWGLFDYPGMEDVSERIDQARDLFIKAMQSTDQPEAAARHADKALGDGLWASEEMCRLHASVFLARRRQNGQEIGGLGVTLPASSSPKVFDQALSDVFSFARIPLVWRMIQPKEQGADYRKVDACVKACTQAGLALRGGPLLNFGVRSVPDWMYIWENDYEAISDFAREHVRRTVKRYKGSISSWVIASGLHADNVFPFNFEQIMDMTRMAATTIKQVAPRAQTVLDLTQPWGEYYARNQRTVPPLLYAEMAVQNAIPFDAFGLQFLFGLESDGFRVRDLMQVSAMLDRLANLGKPLHITAAGVPSKPGGGGGWHEPWSPELQSEWFSQFAEIALSKPYVESVCIDALVDTDSSSIPNSGVLTEALKPKAVFSGLAKLRSRITEKAKA